MDLGSLHVFGELCVCLGGLHVVGGCVFGGVCIYWGFVYIRGIGRCKGPGERRHMAPSAKSRVKSLHLRFKQGVGRKQDGVVNRARSWHAGSSNSDVKTAAIHYHFPLSSTMSAPKE